MIRVDVTLPVNDPAAPDQPALDRDQVWAGLLRKAENAVPFVPGMEACTVLERASDGLVREVVVKGEAIREDVTFTPKERVSFSRADDRAAWVIHNVIGEDAAGALTLTFIGEMTAGPMADDAGDPDPERRREARPLRAAAVGRRRSSCEAICGAR
ncbi:SRPBCC family protein [Streptomyces inhibens]|uniref:SRPBCC family protein n=1 Tax=Streptomyces inhibens TaxID=2293571 RepID=UPI0015F2723B|nr:SRPBCC family protein [Streptomyces inhibens]